MITQRALRISVGGTGSGKGSRHLPVACRREQHRHHSHEVSQRGMTVGDFLDNPINRIWRRGRKDDQPVENQVA